VSLLYRHGPAGPGYLNQHRAVRGGPDEPDHDGYESSRAVT